MLRCLYDSVHFNSRARIVAASDFSWANEMVLDATIKQARGSKGLRRFIAMYIALLNRLSKLFVIPVPLS